MKLFQVFDNEFSKEFLKVPLLYIKMIQILFGLLIRILMMYLIQKKIKHFALENVPGGF